jgi:ribosomal subunit interface protein
MNGPFELTVKDVNKTPELEEFINSKVAKLEKICSHMISCRVMIEQPQKNQDRGSPYRVRVDITVPPSHEIVAKQSSSKGDIHDTLQSVIVNVFNAAIKQLKELTDRQHGEVKTHPHQQVMGIVNQVFPDRDYGFIKTLDTQEDIYFHKNSVLHDKFDKMTVGTGTRFIAEVGEKGLQASSVEIMYKPGDGKAT